MKLTGFCLSLAVLILATTAITTTCSPHRRSNKAVVVDDYGSMRYINGRPDRVHKKWKSNSYTPKNTKVAKRRTADW